MRGRIWLFPLFLVLLSAISSAQPVIDLGADSGMQVVRSDELPVKTQVSVLLYAAPGIRFGQSMRFDIPLRIVMTDWSSATEGFVYNAYWGTGTGIRLGRYWPAPGILEPFVDTLFGGVAVYGNWIRYRNTWLVSFYPSTSLSLEAVHPIGRGGFYWSVGLAGELHVRKDMDFSSSGNLTVRVGFDASERVQ